MSMRIIDSSHVLNIERPTETIVFSRGFTTYLRPFRGNSILQGWDYTLYGLVTLVHVGCWLVEIARNLGICGPAMRR